MNRITQILTAIMVAALLSGCATTYAKRASLSLIHI